MMDGGSGLAHDVANLLLMKQRLASFSISRIERLLGKSLLMYWSMVGMVYQLRIIAMVTTVTKLLSRSLKFITLSEPEK